MNKLLTVIFGILTVVTFYFYNENHKNKIQLAEERITNLIEVNERANTVIETINERVIFQSQEINNLEIKNNIAISKNQELQNLLSKHDLEYLAKMKPKLIENRINSSTKQVIKELEEITNTRNFSGDLNE